MTVWLNDLLACIEMMAADLRYKNRLTPTEPVEVALFAEIVEQLPAGFTLRLAAAHIIVKPVPSMPGVDPLAGGSIQVMVYGANSLVVDPDPAWHPGPYHRPAE